MIGASVVAAPKLICLPVVGLGLDYLIDETRRRLTGQRGRVLSLLGSKVLRAPAVPTTQRSHRVGRGGRVHVGQEEAVLEEARAVYVERVSGAHALEAGHDAAGRVRLHKALEGLFEFDARGQQRQIGRARRVLHGEGGATLVVVAAVGETRCCWCRWLATFASLVVARGRGLFACGATCRCATTSTTTTTLHFCLD